MIDQKLIRQSCIRSLTLLIAKISETSLVANARVESLALARPPALRKTPCHGRDRHAGEMMASTQKKEGMVGI